VPVAFVRGVDVEALRPRLGTVEAHDALGEQAVRTKSAPEQHDEPEEGSEVAPVNRGERCPAPVRRSPQEVVAVDEEKRRYVLREQADV
jgi:hypothetical protein